MRSRRHVGLLAALAVSSLLFIQSSLAVSPSQADSKQKKPWTFLVYLNAFNNLDRFGFSDLNEMEQIGSTEKVNVVVQWASYSQRDVRRLLVQKDADPRTVTSPVLQNLGKIDMGDYRTLEEFVRWGKETYPAEQYFVAVWNHGSGWHRTRMNGDVVGPRDISWDDFSDNSITTEQLGLAMNNIKEILGQKVDIYGSDACLMSMAEVAGEMKNAVNVSVGSQHLEPGDGWPYHFLLKEWNEKEKATERDVAEILVKSYLKFYPDDTEITLSAFDLRNYDQLATSMRNLKNTIQGAPAALRAKLLRAAQASIDFYDSDYRDISDFANEVQKATTEVEFNRTTLNEVKAAVGQFVFANAVSDDQAKAKGVSFWLPVYSSTYNSYADRYKGLVFNQDTDWATAAQTIVTK
jgi:hypothetical protein